MTDTPVVLVNEPRQCGKTTLVRSLLKSDRPYFTLDDDTTLASAKADPVGFIRQIDMAILDEVQWAPRTPARHQGRRRQRSASWPVSIDRIRQYPCASDRLGKPCRPDGGCDLLPLGQAEILGRNSNFLDQAFAGELSSLRNVMVGPDLIERVLTGGYPEMIARTDPRRRTALAREYVRAIVERDVREIAYVERLDQMPQLLRALAHHSGQLLNFAQLAEQISLDDKTARHYIGIFENLFLVRRIEPWFRNPLTRVLKTPKLFFLDSGLLAALTGLTQDRVAKDRSMFVSFSKRSSSTRYSGSPHGAKRDRLAIIIVTRTRTRSISSWRMRAATSLVLK
jgi:uncharacterized protein